MAKKSLGESVLGWFVVKEDEQDEPLSEPPERPTPVPLPRAAPVRPAMASPAPPPPMRAPTAAAPPSLRGPVQVPVVVAGATPTPETFAQVYRAAQIPETDESRFEKAKSLLSSLPAEAPADVKRQIVEASLKAFGIPVEGIIETGVEQIQALEAYIQHGARHTQEVLQEGQGRIEKLQSDIVEIRKLMELQIKTQNDLAKGCNAEKLKAQSVLEFFGQEAVAKVVRASPKLVEPST